MKKNKIDNSYGVADKSEFDINCLVCNFDFYNKLFRGIDKDDIVDNYLVTKIRDYVKENEGNYINIYGMIEDITNSINVFDDPNISNNYLVKYLNKSLEGNVVFFNDFIAKEKELPSKEDLIVNDINARLLSLIKRTPIFNAYISDGYDVIPFTKDFCIALETNYYVPRVGEIDLIERFNQEPEKVDTLKNLIEKEIDRSFDCASVIMEDTKKDKVKVKDYKSIFFHFNPYCYSESHQFFVNNYESLREPLAKYYNIEKTLAFGDIRDANNEICRNFCKNTLDQVLINNPQFVARNNNIIISDDFKKAFKEAAQENLENFKAFTHKNVNREFKSHQQGIGEN